MEPDLWSLYELMLRSRLFETLVKRLWSVGMISGEMHLGVGEEAVVAGIVAHLREGDALALDHRGTPPLVMRGVDRSAILEELLGYRTGLCGGRGGHMHLYSKEHLAASSGIVGAAGPAAAGFALASQHREDGGVAVAFFGDGAMNQGMLLESMNLAAAWRLGVVFICKDNGWAITTRSRDVTRGDLSTRARGLGLWSEEVDGSDVESCWNAARRAVHRGRQQQGPSFILARCPRMEGHFLGDPLVRTAQRPLEEGSRLAGPLTRAALSAKGASPMERLSSLGEISRALLYAARDERGYARDPLVRARRRLSGDAARLEALEQSIELETRKIWDGVGAA